MSEVIRKTKLCRGYLNGMCTYETDKCHFAHGSSDLHETVKMCENAVQVWGVLHRPHRHLGKARPTSPRPPSTRRLRPIGSRLRSRSLPRSLRRPTSGAPSASNARCVCGVRTTATGVYTAPLHPTPPHTRPHPAPPHPTPHSGHRGL